MSGSSLRIVVPALLVIVGSVPANLPPAHAADGTIVVQRQVQPRVAYRPSMVPDPHPTVVDTNVSAEVNALANGAASGNTVSRELGDADFAIVTSGSGIRSMILPGGALPGFANQPANPATVQAVGNVGTTHGAGGGAGAGLAGQINGSLKQGLAPLQMLGRTMKRLSALLLAFACIASLQADPLASRNRASIDASGTYRGNFALNQAAGDAQQQSNVRVVAVGSAALVGSDQRQHLQLDASQPIAASASISGAALRGSGILGVDQGAGLGNQQINAFRLSLSNGPESLDDSVLAQSVALTKVSGSATPVPGGRSVSTDDRAFAGSSGVVQVNQSAGVGNQSMNTLSVRVME